MLLRMYNIHDDDNTQDNDYYYDRNFLFAMFYSLFRILCINYVNILLFKMLLFGKFIFGMTVFFYKHYINK